MSTLRITWLGAEIGLESPSSILVEGLLFLEPLFHAAGDVGDVFEAVLEHPFSGSGAAHADGAVDEVFGVFGEVGRDGGPAAEGEELGALDVGHEVFILFTDVEEDAIEAVGEDFAKLEGGDFRKRSHFFFVDEWFGDGGVFAAERAVRITLDFDFAEGGGEGSVVDETTEG